MTERRWPCHRCGMTFLLQRPPYMEKAEALLCPECGIVFGSGYSDKVRPRSATCWLIKAGDARELQGVRKLELTSPLTLD